MSEVIDVSDSTFDDIVNQSNLVLVDFWAQWCGVCRKFEKIIESIATEDLKDIKIVKLEVDKNPIITQKYSVVGLPTVLIFKNGELVERLTSATTKSKLIELIEKHEDKIK